MYNKRCVFLQNYFPPSRIVSNLLLYDDGNSAFKFDVRTKLQKLPLKNW